MVLIPCSSRKQGGGDAHLRWSPADSVVSRLSRASAQNLVNARRELARRFGYEEGEDLGGVMPASTPLMRAHRRYDGNLYRQIDEGLWPLVMRSHLVEVVIVSALYGLLDPREPIRFYQHQMTESFDRRMRLSRWWSERGLGSLLVEYVESTRVSMVHDFLSAGYRPVARPLLALRGDITIKTHSYPKLGSGADYHRGKDVGQVLEAYEPRPAVILCRLRLWARVRCV
jgi:Peroxide stress protein YaaA